MYFFWVLLLQLVECFIQSHEIDVRFKLCIINKIHPLKVTASFESSLLASILDEDPPHGFGSRTKEMSTTVPVSLFP